MFIFQVSRSLAVCDGILLLVAANQGVQAQTIANFWLAFEKNIQIIPVINKIDLPGADIKSVSSLFFTKIDNARRFQVETQLKTLFEFNPEECLRISAKSGLNVARVLDAIIERVPAPIANIDAPFRY